MTWTREAAHMQTLDADSRYRVTAWQLQQSGEWRFRGHRVSGDGLTLMEIIWTPDAAEARAETERQCERDNDAK